MDKTPVPETVALRVRRVDAAIAEIARARAKGVNVEESKSLADLERQGLILTGFLMDVVHRNVELNALEAQKVFSDVDRWCEIVGGLGDAIGEAQP